jgi:hypothetical protein
MDDRVKRNSRVAPDPLVRDLYPAVPKPISLRVSSSFQEHPRKYVELLCLRLPLALFAHPL